MSTPQMIAVTSNDLGLRNPQRWHGLGLLLYGGFLGIVVAVRIPMLITEVKAEHTALERVQLLATMGLIAAAGLIVALWLLYRGALAMLSFFVSAGAPAEIGDAGRAVPTLLARRTIDGTYVRPGSLVHLLLHGLFPRFTYLTPPHRPLLQGFVPAALILVGAVVFWSVTGLVPGLLLFIVFVAFGVLVGAVLTSRARVPRVDIYEGQQQLLEAGNPIDLFNHVRASLDRLRVADFPNRLLGERPPNVGVLAGTNQFEAEIQLETQPLPLQGVHRLPINALILDVAGVILGWLGWGLLLFQPMVLSDPADNRFGADGESVKPMEVPPTNGRTQPGKLVPLNLSYLLVVLTALAILEFSRRFLTMAYGLHNTFRFRSDLFWLCFTGSYTASRIGVGDGRGGQFFSHKDRIQSDVRVQLYATCVITECTAADHWRHTQDTAALTRDAETALQTPRYLVKALRDEEFQGRLNHLVNQLAAYRDNSDALAGIKMEAPSVQQIIHANLQIVQVAEAARMAGRGLPAPVVQQPPALPPPVSRPPALPPPMPPAVKHPAPPPAVSAPPRPPQPAGPAPALQTVACPHCRQRYQVRAGVRLRLRCQGCRQLFEVA